MEEYTVEVRLTIKVEAPDRDDVNEMIQDHYGEGSGGEGVTVVHTEFTVE